MRKRAFGRNLGLTLAGVWLISRGLVTVLHLSFSGLAPLTGLVAIAAGVFLLLGR